MDIPDRNDPKTGNPMLDDYLDSNKNAHKNMSAQNQPGFKAQQKLLNGDEATKLLTEAECKGAFELRIFKVPKDLTEHGLNNLFAKYGNFLDSFLCRPRDGEVNIFFNFFL